MQTKILSLFLGLFSLAFAGPSEGQSDSLAKEAPAIKKSLASQSKKKKIKKSAPALKSSRSSASAKKSQQRKFSGSLKRAFEEEEINNSLGLTCFASQGNLSLPGYVQLSKGCSADDSLCVGFSSVMRNWCKEGAQNKLIRYYCDPSKEHLFSMEEITCKTECKAGICI